MAIHLHLKPAVYPNPLDHSLFTRLDMNDFQSIRNKKVKDEVGLAFTICRERVLQEAGKGNPGSMCLVGKAHLYGADDIQEDVRQAIDWFYKAAEKDHSAAMVELGILNETGSGFPKDYEEALEWYLNAVELEDGFAMYRLGVLYKEGPESLRDVKLAQEWFEKAVEKCPLFANWIREKGTSRVIPAIMTERYFSVSSY